MESGQTVDLNIKESLAKKDLVDLEPYCPIELVDALFLRHRVDGKIMMPLDKLKRIARTQYTIEYNKAVKAKGEGSKSKRISQGEREGDIDP